MGRNIILHGHIDVHAYTTCSVIFFSGGMYPLVNLFHLNFGAAEQICHDTGIFC